MGKLALFEHITESLLAAKNFSAELISELAQIVREIEQAKADKPKSVSATIPNTGWSRDNDTSYPNYYDIPVQGVTVQDRAEITLYPDSLEIAKACGLCPTNETLTGKIRVRAFGMPASTLNIEYWIEKGKE